MVGGRQNLVYSPGPGLSPGNWDLGPSGPNLTMRLENFKKLFPMHVSKHDMNTRHGERYQIIKSNGKRYSDSAIPKMLRLLNKEYREQKENLNKLKKSIVTNKLCLY